MDLLILHIEKSGVGKEAETQLKRMENFLDVKVWMGLLVSSLYFFVCSIIVVKDAKGSDVIQQIFGKRFGMIMFRTLSVFFLVMTAIFMAFGK